MIDVLLEDQLMSASDLAEYLGSPVSWVYNNKHDLPTIRVGRELRFRRRDIDDWLEGRRETPRLRRVGSSHE